MRRIELKRDVEKPRKTMRDRMKLGEAGRNEERRAKTGREYKQEEKDEKRQSETERVRVQFYTRRLDKFLSK